MMKFVILACLVVGSLAFTYRRSGFDSRRSLGRRNWDLDIDFRSGDFGLGGDPFDFPLDRRSRFDSWGRDSGDLWNARRRSRVGRLY